MLVDVLPGRFAVWHVDSLEWMNKNSAERLRKNLNSLGYCVIPGVFSSQEITQMRPVLESLFDQIAGENTTSLPWSDISEQDLQSNLITSLFFDGRISILLRNLFPFENVQVLPVIQLHKNYLPHSRRKSWHVDAGSQRVHSEYRTCLSDNKFVFGHIGIYFQENGPYGGSIDVVPRSHNGLKYGNPITMKLIDYFIQILSRFPITSTPLRRLFSRRVNLGLGDVVLFDWRVFHRGSPASRKNEKSIFYSADSYRAALPPKFSKLTLYSRYGNGYGWHAHMDQMKQKDSPEIDYGIQFFQKQ
jgi:ectoine hydroxylase-related dioxygenase (phytanoyl-CoA dioxygenase family)